MRPDRFRPRPGCPERRAATMYSFELDVSYRYPRGMTNEIRIRSVDVVVRGLRRKSDAGPGSCEPCAGRRTGSSPLRRHAACRLTNARLTLFPVRSGRMWHRNSSYSMTEAKMVGHHTFPPPVWAAVDGSKFTGQVKARANAPQAGAGQWLLLSTRSTGAEGRFSKITSLQRVNTVGGVAPLSRCEAGNIGVAEQTPLAAEFVFFSK